MENWLHSISEIKKEKGNCIVVGNTFDDKSEKNIEWEFEINSDGTLIRSSPHYIAELYEATKLNEVMIKKIWNKEQQMKAIFHEVDTKCTWVVDEKGCMCRTE